MHKHSSEANPGATCDTTLAKRYLKDGIITSPPSPPKTVTVPHHCRFNSLYGWMTPLPNLQMSRISLSYIFNEFDADVNIADLEQFVQKTVHSTSSCKKTFKHKHNIETCQFFTKTLPPTSLFPIKG